MLEGLDDIDWASLTHAYGAAQDVPPLLHALTSEAPETRKDAIAALYGNIYHQGTVYQASAYAAPFLIALLREPAVADKGQILALLASLAEGTSYHEVHGFWRTSDDDAAILDRELDWVKVTRRAVAKGSADYLSLLADGDVTVRRIAPFTLAQSIVRDRHAADQMMFRARDELDDIARASLLLGIGAVADPLDRSCLEFLTGEMSAAMPPIVRLAASLALRRIGGEEVLNWVVPVVLATAGPAMAQGNELVWIQMGRDFFSEIDHWLGGPAEARFDFFKKMVERTSGSVRATVVYAMMHFCGEHPAIAALSAPLMTKLLRDEDAVVRRSGLSLLDDVPDSRSDALATLIEMAGRTREQKELRQIAKVICHYHEASLVPVLAGFIRQNLGSDVIKSLGALGPEAAGEAPLLVQVLNSPSPSGSPDEISNTQIAAALALGEMGPSAAKIAVPALIRAFNDGRARRAVPQALGRIGPLARSAERLLLRASQQGDALERGCAVLALWQIDAWPARVATEALTSIFRLSAKAADCCVSGLSQIH